MTLTTNHTSVTSTPVSRQSDALYTDVLSPAGARAVRERVRAMADEVVAPAAHAIAEGDERVEGFPREVFDELGRQGLFRIPFAEEVGARV